MTQLFMYSKEGEREALALALRNRDPEVLDVLIGRFQYRLFRYLVYLTGNRENAMPVVGDELHAVDVSGSGADTGLSGDRIHHLLPDSGPVALQLPAMQCIR